MKCDAKVEASTLSEDNKDLCLQILAVMEASQSVQSTVEFCDDGGLMITSEQGRKSAIFVFPSRGGLAYLVAEWGDGDDDYKTGITRDAGVAPDLRSWLESDTFYPPPSDLFGFLPPLPHRVLCGSQTPPKQRRRCDDED